MAQGCAPARKAARGKENRALGGIVTMPGTILVQGLDGNATGNQQPRQGSMQRHGVPWREGPEGECSWCS
jgi:hypothetical protein